MPNSWSVTLLTFHFPEAMQYMTLSLDPHRTKTILTIHEKGNNRPPLAESPKGASRTVIHTTPPPLFLQTSPGGTPTWPFSIRLLPVELPS